MDPVDALVALALAGARELGASCAVVVPHALALPPFAPLAADPGDGVRRLRAQVAAEAGVIFGVSELSGTYPPDAATALAWLGPDGLRGKAVGLVGAAPGDGAIKALNALSLVLAHMGAMVVPAPVGVVSSAVSAAGAVADERLAARVRDVGRALGRFLMR